MPTFTTEELTDLTARALQRAGASKAMALATAQALVAAESEGLARSRRVARRAVRAARARRPRRRQGEAEGRRSAKARRVSSTRAAGSPIEASALAVNEAIKRARRYGVAFSGVTNSHHFGAAAYHLAPIAEAGLVGLAFTNSPAAINAWGGKRAFYGTNPDRGDLSADAMRRRSSSISRSPKSCAARSCSTRRKASRYRSAGRSTGTASPRPTRRPR